MTLIIFTTCKPFINDDAWRQEQAIKSWTNIQVPKKIIIIGNDEGVENICNKYNLIHINNIKLFNNIPYVHEMFEIASSYAKNDDILLWTNSDMIYFNEDIQKIIIYINNLKKTFIKDYVLVGQRYDWCNPKILNNFDKQEFINNSVFMKKNDVSFKKTVEKNEKYELNLHSPTGIDYIIHHKNAFLNKIDKSLVIAGTAHDMILLGAAINNNYFVCNITDTNFVVHQNHGYLNERDDLVKTLKKNNLNCKGTLISIDHPKIINI